ncbi:MAG: metallophosphoesterase [Muribaculum sp.]|nr:metallophosphoesterase [Muribaculum sp.]
MKTTSYTILALSSLFISFSLQGCTTDFEPLPPVERSSSNCIFVIGDVQEYTNNDKDIQYLSRSVKWINNWQLSHNNISAVVCVGDISDKNKDEQWQRADNCFSLFDPLLTFIPVTGNHDYTWSPSPEGYYFNGKHIVNSMFVYDRNSSGFDGLSCLQSLKPRISHRFEEGKSDNIIVPIDINGRWVDIIALEFAPRREVIQWADSIVKSNPDRRYIFLTHEFLTRYGQIVKDEDLPHSIRQFYSDDVYTPTQIWEKLIYPNDNIMFVICGHNGFLSYRTDKNAAGRNVVSLLFNLQYINHGGNGYLLKLNFPNDSDEVLVSVPNSEKNQQMKNPISQFSFSISDQQPEIAPSYIVPNDVK